MDDHDRVSAQYYKEVGCHIIPTPDQERELFTRYRDALDTGNRAAATRLRHEIACGYLKFVMRRASRRTRNKTLRSELIAEGNIGLMVAIDKFDVTLGHRFLTYAASWIEVFMREHINKALPVHMPNHKRKELRRKRADEDRLITQGKLREHSEAEPSATTIDNVVIPAPTTETDAVLQRNATVMHYMASAGLSMRQRFVVTHHFGLRGGESKNLRDLSALFYLVDGSCLPNDKVKRLLDEGLTALRRYLVNIGLTSVADAL